ncbi:MAG: hypothetical protein RLZZ574_2388, partial [Cyanobacteriota bacterium]
KASSSSIDGKTYGTVWVSDDDGSYSLEIVGDEIIKKEGKGKVSYKLGSYYSAFYEVKGYGTVSSYTSVVG